MVSRLNVLWGRSYADTYIHKTVKHVHLFLTFGFCVCLASTASAQFYQQTNLVSDINGLAKTHDPNLVNAWGLTSSSTSPWWISDNGTGISALYNRDVAGPGLGFVDVFDTMGNWMMSLNHGRWMNSPWGLAMAPASFGKFSNHILVGNFGSGRIATFDPVHGNFHGLLRGLHGLPITIDGLWARRFGNDHAAGPSTTLFFTAGIDDENHGLFGTLTPIPKDGD